MTIWRSLRDAYGTAGPVEALLERGDTDDRAIWAELWSRLCHQGTVYTASYAALPRLAELAARQDPSGFVEPLFLATCIVASTDGPEAPAAVRVRYAETIRALHEVAEGLVPFAADDADFIYRVQAVLATESDSAWATRLEALANQELEFACPGCDEQLVMGLETSPALVKQFDDSSVGVTTVAPSDPGRLKGSEARAYELATTHRRPQVAKQLLDLFGIFECPACHCTGRTSAALSWRPRAVRPIRTACRDLGSLRPAQLRLATWVSHTCASILQQQAAQLAPAIPGRTRSPRTGGAAPTRRNHSSRRTKRRGRGHRRRRDTGRAGAARDALCADPPRLAPRRSPEILAATQYLRLNESALTGQVVAVGRYWSA